MSFGVMNGEPFFCYRRPDGKKFAGSPLVVFAREALSEAKPGSFKFSDEPPRVYAEKKRYPDKPRQPKVVIYPDRPCQICQKNFTPRKSWAINCSPECSRQHRYNLSNEKNKKQNPNVTGKNRSRLGSRYSKG